MSKKAPPSKSKIKAEIPIKAKVKELTKLEGQYFQELVDVSNRFTGLKQQKAQYEFILKKLQENRKKIQTDVIKLPVYQWLIPNVMLYPEFDKKVVLKFFDEHIKNYQNSLTSIIGQIEHRYEEYAESAVRSREFLQRKYGTLVAKKIVPDRKEIADEENLFEGEFKKLMEDDEIRKEFNKAKMEAVRRNKARKTKKASK